MTDAPDRTPTDSAQPVLVEREGGVATVRLNRPEAMNSLDVATKDALLAALREVADDASVRCVVLTGSGRAFCVGQDLKEHVGFLKAQDPTLWETVPQHYSPIVELLSTMNKPVVAALNGVAAGAGAAFAFAADFRVMVDSGGFNLAFAGIALSCDSGSSWWLPRLVGPAKAKELLLLPRTIKAEEALSLGLVTQVVTADELEQVVGELASRLAAGPTLAYGSIRRAVAYSAGHPLSESLAHEAELMTLTGGSADHTAAVDAFLAKEKPTFTGS
ncbi:MAG TPA: enoyl-CoA hydratase-related protein [Segeticoccus sp.]|uniref:enoyl-CoA hydratase/isomerase family protein n=1 Tax=Segeticoccus sp. TaxID=2706531 RepID=UPI002D7F4C05|nr:enoyl-CoA hydratase-related protein [Segeticoccus sp.]HET8599888.1 enoyl-CoA hydratase-related protein [Segeticoccus sp.]